MICQNDWHFLSEELDLVKGGLTNRKQSCRKYPLGTWKCRHRSGSTRRDKIYKPSYPQNRNSSAHASDYTGLSESKTGTTKVLFTLRSCGKRTLAALLQNPIFSDSLLHCPILLQVLFPGGFHPVWKKSVR